MLQCWNPTSRRGRWGSSAGRLQLRTECERHTVGPSESVLRGVFAPARPPIQIDDIVLFRHAADCRVRFAIEREPAVARFVRKFDPAIPADALDGHPFERWPPVGSIPLLARPEHRSD